MWNLWKKDKLSEISHWRKKIKFRNKLPSLLPSRRVLPIVKGSLKNRKLKNSLFDFPKGKGRNFKLDNLGNFKLAFSQDHLFKLNSQELYSLAEVFLLLFRLMAQEKGVESFTQKIYLRIGWGMIYLFLLLFMFFPLDFVMKTRFLLLII